MSQEPQLTEESQSQESQSTPEVDEHAVAAATEVVEPETPQKDSNEADPAVYTPEHEPTTEEDRNTQPQQDVDADPAAYTPEHSPTSYFIKSSTKPESASDSIEL